MSAQQCLSPLPFQTESFIYVLVLGPSSTAHKDYSWQVSSLTYDQKKKSYASKKKNKYLLVGGITSNILSHRKMLWFLLIKNLVGERATDAPVEQ